MTDQDINNRFTYHAPQKGQPEKYDEIRDKARNYAHRLNFLLPESREKSLAITHLEEVVFWANASIARST
jgi:hypothetical protein